MLHPEILGGGVFGGQSSKARLLPEWSNPHRTRANSVQKRHSRPDLEHGSSHFPRKRLENCFSVFSFCSEAAFGFSKGEGGGREAGFEGALAP